MTKMSRKLTRLRIMVLIGLGAMVLLVFGLLPGCGSDSKPAGAVARKNEKAAKKSSMPVPVMFVKEGIVIELDKKAGDNSGSVSRRIVVAAPGVTPEQLQANLEETRKLLQSPGYEVMPGFTKEMAQSKLEEAWKLRDSASSEVMPAVSKETVEAKLAESRKVTESSGYEVLPGLTQEKLEARLEESRKLRESSDYEVLPGVTKAMLEAKGATMRGNPDTGTKERSPGGPKNN